MRALELYRKASELAPSLDSSVRRRAASSACPSATTEAIRRVREGAEAGARFAAHDSAMAQALGGRRGPGYAARLSSSAAAPRTRARTSSRFILVPGALMAQQPAELGAAPTSFARSTGHRRQHVMLTLAALMTGEVQLAPYHWQGPRRGHAGRAVHELAASSTAWWRTPQRRARAADRRDPGRSSSAPHLHRSVGGVMLALLTPAVILSRLTLRSAERVAGSGEAGGDGTDQERGLRRSTAVVTMSGIYFTCRCRSARLDRGGPAVAPSGCSADRICPDQARALRRDRRVRDAGRDPRGLFVRSGHRAGTRSNLGRIPVSATCSRRSRAPSARARWTARIMTPHTDMAVTERGGL